MSPVDALPQLTEILRDVLDLPDLVVTSESTADDVPGWDSMAHITIVVEAEQRFSVKFRTSEIEALHNVGDFAALIAARTS